MKSFKLPFWEITSIRQEIYQLLMQHSVRAYWVGAVSGEDREAMSKFLTAAKSGLVEELVKYQHIGGNLIYAVILEKPNGEHMLFLIESPESPDIDERCVASHLLSPDLKIEGYEPNYQRVETELRKNTQLGLKEVFKALLGID